MAKKINKVLTTQAVPLTSEEVQNLGLTLSAVLERTILPTEALWIPNVTDVGILSWRLGTAGDPGPSDVNIRGAQGIQGPQGPQGPQGDKGDKGDQGEQGDMGLCPDINPATKNWMIYEDHRWKDTGYPSSGAVGPRGPEGPQGPEGKQGIQGPAGKDGEDGDKGDPGNDLSARSYPDQSNLGVQVEIWQKGESAPDTIFLLESGYTPSAHVTPIGATEQHPAGGYNLQFMLPNGGSYGDSFNIWNGEDGSMAGAPSIEGNRGISAEFLGDSKYVVGISGGFVDKLLVSSAQKSELSDLATSAAFATSASFAEYYNDGEGEVSIAETFGYHEEGIDYLYDNLYLTPQDPDRPSDHPIYSDYATSAYLGGNNVSSFSQFKTAIDDNKTAIQSKLSTVNRDATLSGDGKNTALGLINAYKQAIETVSGKMNIPSLPANKEWLLNSHDGNLTWYEAQTWIANRFNPVNGLSGYGVAMDGKYYVGINASAMTHDKRYGWRKGFGWFADPIQWVSEVNGTYDGNQNYQHMQGDTLNFYKTMIHPAGTTSAEGWANDNIIHIILEA